MQYGTTPIRWFRRLEAHVLVSGAIVAGAALVALLTGAEQVITLNARQQVSEDLRSAKTTFDRLLSDRTAFASSQMRLITELPVFRAHLTDPNIRRDRATISAMVEHHRASLESEFCLLTEADGQTIGSAGAELPPGSLFGMDETAVGQLQQSIVSLNHELYLVVSEPVRFADELLGILTAGYSVDDEMAGELAQRTRAEVSFLSGGRIVGSSLPPSQLPAVDELQANDLTQSHPGPISPVWSESEGHYVGRTYTLASVGSVGDAKDASIVLLADWRPTRQVLDEIRSRLVGLPLARSESPSGGCLFSAGECHDLSRSSQKLPATLPADTRRDVC